MSGIWLISYIALWILFLVLAVVLLSVMRNLGVIYESMKNISSRSDSTPTGLKTGTSLPAIDLQTLDGDSVSISRFFGEKVAFSIVSSRCPSCETFIDKIAQEDIDPDQLDSTVRKRVIISLSDIDHTKLLIKPLTSHNIPILIDVDGKTRQKWGIGGTPVTIVVDERSTIKRQIIGGYINGTVSEEDRQSLSQLSSR